MATKRIVGSVYYYDNGQSKVEFVWDGAARDGYAWSVKRQSRLASYKTKRDVVGAFNSSNNNDGAYGCARLFL
jgi:hypothetical protein